MKPTIAAYMPMTWALNISVHDWSSDTLFVMGKEPIANSELEPSRDAYFRYLSSVQSGITQKGKALSSPHLSFSNATGDEALIEFVKEFGPVAANSFSEDKVDQTTLTGPSFEEMDWRTLVGATQELPTLRAERRTYAAALQLLAELRRGEKAISVPAIRQHISDIAEGVLPWAQQREAERKWRMVHGVSPVAWHFDSNRCDFIQLLKRGVLEFQPPRQDGSSSTGSDRLDRSLVTTEPYRAGHLVLCTLINAFDTEVQFFADRPIETLPFGSLRFGVRPILYLILKHLYLGGVGVLVCGNDRCRRFFEPEKGRQRFCTAECSQHFRQRTYWKKSGSDLRKQRTAERRKKTITRTKRRTKR
jgi:hypothetical protein